MGHVFISYSHNPADATYAKAVHDALEANHIQTWFDMDSIRAGDKWPRKIRNGILGADVFLVLDSIHYRSSRYCGEEIKIATRDARNLQILWVCLDSICLNVNDDIKIGDSQRVPYDCANGSPKKLVETILAEEIIQRQANHRYYLARRNGHNQLQFTDALSGCANHHVVVRLFYNIVERFAAGTGIATPFSIASNLVLVQDEHGQSFDVDDELLRAGEQDSEITREFLRTLLASLCFGGVYTDEYEKLPFSRALIGAHNESAAYQSDVYALFNRELDNVAKALLSGPLDDISRHLSYLADATEYYERYLEKNMFDGRVCPLVLEVANTIVLNGTAYRPLPIVCEPTIIPEGNIVLGGEFTFDELCYHMQKNAGMPPRSMLFFGESGLGKSAIFNRYCHRNKQRVLYCNLADVSEQDQCPIANSIENRYHLRFADLLNYAGYEEPVMLVLDNIDRSIADKSQLHAEIHDISEAMVCIVESNRRNQEDKFAISEAKLDFENFDYYEMRPLDKCQIIAYLKYKQVDEKLLSELKELDEDNAFFDFFNTFHKLHILCGSLDDTQKWDPKRMGIELLDEFYLKEEAFSIPTRVADEIRRATASLHVDLRDTILSLVKNEMQALMVSAWSGDFADLSNLVFRDIFCRYSILKETPIGYRLYSEDLRCYFSSKYIKDCITVLLLARDYAQIESILSKVDTDYNVLLYLYRMGILDLLRPFIGAVGPKGDELHKEYTSLYHTLFKISQYKTGVGSLFDITELPDNFFYGAENIVGITLPRTIRKIGRACFANMSRLEYIDCSRVGGELTILPWAIINCPKLVYVRFNQHYTHYAQPLFMHCPKLARLEFTASDTFALSHDGAMLLSKDGNTVYMATNALYGVVRLPENVKHIAPNAFSRLDHLTGLVIPATIEDISTDFVDFSSSLERIEIDGVSSLYSADENGIMYIHDERGKVLFRVPSGYRGEVIIPNDVDVIGSDSISCCAKVTRVWIPASVYSIEDYAFADTVMMERIQFEECTRIEWGNYVLLNARPDVRIVYDDTYNMEEFHREILNSGSDNRLQPLSHGEVTLADFEEMGCVPIGNAHLMGVYDNLVLFRDINPYAQAYIGREQDLNVFIMGMTEFNKLNNMNETERIAYIQSMEKKHIQVVLLTRDIPLIGALAKGSFAILRTSRGTTSITNTLLEGLA